MTLPEGFRQVGWNALDPRFQDNIRDLIRIEGEDGRDSPAYRAALEVPWVTEHPFDPSTAVTHCPHGHEGPQGFGDPPHDSYQGHEFVRRRCAVCRSTWLEPLP